MRKKSFLTSLLVSSLIFSLFTVFIIISDGTPDAVLKIIWALVISILAFFMLYTGRIYPYRAAFYIIMAWAFLLNYKASLIGLENFFLANRTMDVPYCHIAQCSSILNTSRNIYLALGSGEPLLWIPLSMGVLWLLITLLIGQGFCSWGCFYGGIDETFSLLKPKKLFPKFKVPKKLRDLPAAILIISIIFSFINVLPFFCLWMCPLKITPSFLNPDSAVRLVQSVSYMSIGILFLIILPLLIGKRTFCGYICPFGAWQAFVGRLNPFRISVEKDKCTKCMKCAQVCPTNVIYKDDLEKGIISSYCNRCGRCVDVCEPGAIRYTVLGTDFTPHERLPKVLRELLDARVFFIIAAFILGGAISMIFVPGAIRQVFGF